MFKNLTLYRIGPGWAPTVATMEAALDALRFVPCGATQDKAVGWVEPRGEAHAAWLKALMALDEHLHTAAQRARQDHDMVVWDAPAMTQWSDAVPLAAACDGVVVVIEMDETRVDALRFLRDTLARHRIPILGSVLNRSGRYWPLRRAHPAASKD